LSGTRSRRPSRGEVDRSEREGIWRTSERGRRVLRCVTWAAALAVSLLLPTVPTDGARRVGAETMTIRLVPTATDSTVLTDRPPIRQVSKGDVLVVWSKLRNAVAQFGRPKGRGRGRRRLDLQDPFGHRRGGHRRGELSGRDASRRRSEPPRRHAELRRHRRTRAIREGPRLGGIGRRRQSLG